VQQLMPTSGLTTCREPIGPHNVRFSRQNEDSFCHG
jgi:hypothetical protein